MPPNTSTDAGADNCTPSDPIGHTAFPPYVPPQPEYADQRYFCRNGKPQSKLQLGTTLDTFGAWHSTEASVFRNAAEDKAELILEFHNSRCNFEARVTLAPADLYELAHRLLDAAHDIEINSAATLKKNQRSRGEA